MEKIEQRLDEIYVIIQKMSKSNACATPLDVAEVAGSSSSSSSSSAAAAAAASRCTFNIGGISLGKVLIFGIILIAVLYFIRTRFFTKKPVPKPPPPGIPQQKSDGPITSLEELIKMKKAQAQAQAQAQTQAQAQAPSNVRIEEIFESESTVKTKSKENVEHSEVEGQDLTTHEGDSKDAIN